MPEDKYDKDGILNLTLCDKKVGAEFHNLACVLRKCGVCGVKKLKEIIEDHVIR